MLILLFYIKKWSFATISLSLLIVIVIAAAASVGIVHAAGFATDWLRVGSQGTGGVTFFNGTVINETTDTDGNDNPITFGDNVRIDGRVWRGETAGSGDDMPFIINDDLTVLGVINGGIGYDNTVSDLTSTTFQGAIDELSYDLSDIISGKSTSADGTIQDTTWLYTVWGYFGWIDGNGDPVYECGNYPSGGPVGDEVGTLTFHPSSATVGSFTADTYYPFRPAFMQTAESGCLPLDAHLQDGEFTGHYVIVGNVVFASADDLVYEIPGEDPVTMDVMSTTEGAYSYHDGLSLNIVSHDTYPSSVTVLTQ